MNNQVYSVQAVVKGLKDALLQYLEAQYHIWNESLIRERKLLLQEDGCTTQRPFLEATPFYQKGEPYSKLNIPKVAKELLNKISNFSPSVGIFPHPFAHQSRALESFLGEERDIIVATGTGSGKTECFLMPILGSLAIEAQQRPHCATKPGCRALLLYPMNALVNDQVSRLRRLFGDERVAAELTPGRNRYVRFGMYTGRTPYPGLRERSKDRQRIKPLFDSLYRAPAETIKKELQIAGKWPSKDMQAFEANGFNTSEDDRELFTRQEMQIQCPDILVTNYSMLEYMLLRPIERSLFDQTKAWLESDSANKLTVVLDEAHVYRGAAGAEVALLLRRLQSRLGVDRDRIRYILTSASLGDSEDAKRKVIEFASDLTGLDPNKGSFALITGERQALENPFPGNKEEADCLASFSLSSFHQMHEDLDLAKSAINDLLRGLGLDSIKTARDVETIQDELFKRLEKFPLAYQLIRLTSKQAISFDELTEGLFPGCENSKSATESFLALVTFARRKEDGRVFAPIRLHLFYRGLVGIYACINPECSYRRDQSQQKSLLGRLFDRPRNECICGSRVYELLTHRDCGAAFLRGYLRDEHGEFLWHESSTRIKDNQSPLVEAHLLVEDRIHPKAGASRIWLHLQTGRIKKSIPLESSYLPVYRSDSVTSVDGKKIVSFNGYCPVCLGKWKSGTTKIMDLRTKGEAPFAHLIRNQVKLQPATRKSDQRFPNAGRKSLLFSDGRQKAARLARDIPREVEQDTFRQVLVLAISELTKLGRDARPNQHLYLAFLSVLRKFNLYLFDGSDRTQLIEDIRRFNRDYESNLSFALDDWVSPNIPGQYQEKLLRHLGNRFYSIPALTLAYLQPTKHALRVLKNELPDLDDSTIRSIGILWIQTLLNDFAFNKDLPAGIRNKAAGYPCVDGSKGKFDKEMRRSLEENYGNCEKLEETYCKILGTYLERRGWFLMPDKMVFQLAVHEPWYQCQQCTVVAPDMLRGRCINCGHVTVLVLKPDYSDYLRARKQFWRDPIVKMLEGKESPFNLTVEEHTAQLSYRDYEEVNATTEKHEILFRDILIEDVDIPVDVLSATTTMEVGVDIGSLVAVGLRNIPPQRQNYQQRAGRSGRRGASVSTVVTFAQNGPHDSYYFSNPKLIIAGDPPLPTIDISNPRIIERHVNAVLLQAFFHQQISTVPKTSNIYFVLGATWEFYTENEPFCFTGFKEWLRSNDARLVLQSIQGWMPDGLDLTVHDVAEGFVRSIEEARPLSQDHLQGETEFLIEFFFNKGLLPSYAFPRDLCALQIEDRELSGRRKVKIIERPQQSMHIALSEYSPGRILVVNKKTYRIRAVGANLTSTVLNRAELLFANAKKFVHCPDCYYVQGTSSSNQDQARCPMCSSQLESIDMIQPEVVFPEGRKELDETDNDQAFTQMTSAQLPVPTADEELDWKAFKRYGFFVHASNQSLVVVNKGDENSGTLKGFFVCELCGYAEFPESAPKGTHERQYFVEGENGYTCVGRFRNVFLGYDFKSDILLFRIALNDPLILELGNPRQRRPLEDASVSLAEALTLSTSTELDIDVRELNSGYRFLKIKQQQYVDIFIYDTLSGGAGYADLAGKRFEEIFQKAKVLLEYCRCDSSCHDCLRHYGNRMIHSNLDRKLALNLIAYVEEGKVPAIKDMVSQKKELDSLRLMLEMEGWQCSSDTQSALRIETKGNVIRLGSYPALLDLKKSNHPLLGKGIIFSDYDLVKNLPDAFQKVIRRS